MKILVTGGTVFVSKFVAQYYVNKGWEVYVLNRGTKPQVEGVHVIRADRHQLGESLKGHHFDVVFDMNSYTKKDMEDLLTGLGSFDQYLFVSSSAVYPETEPQPFTESSPIGPNGIWGKYGTDKIEAEALLMEKVPQAYIVRPPYLYGPMNNVYREAFVFDCAMNDRIFYLPKDGSMKLQFFHVEDMCRLFDILLEKQPAQHIFNVGNKEAVTIREWVTLCYEACGKEVCFREVHEDIDQRKYFSFYNYEYYLGVDAQSMWLKETTDLKEGLKESFLWYKEHGDEVKKKDYFTFIDENLK